MNQCMRGVMAAAVVAALAGTTSATDRSKLPEGANFLAAHARATGTDINIGIIDLERIRTNDDTGVAFTRGINDGMIPNPNAGLPGEPAMIPGNSLGARFMGNFSYTDIAPRMAPGVIAAGTGNDNHPTLAADIAAGGDFRIRINPPANLMQRDFVGVAKASRVYFGGVGGLDVVTDLQSAVDDMFRNKSVRIMNFSVGMGPSNSDNAQQGGAFGADKAALFLDWFIDSRDVLFVKSAGNRASQIRDEENPGALAGDKKISKPGDFYNGITVGATDENFRARAEFSSYHLGNDTGAAPDVRGKPDILAPGDRVWNGKSYTTMSGASGTSFAAPHVTGTAAQIAQRMAGGRQHEAIKAIILNSARKRMIEGSNAGNAIAEDHAMTAMDPSDEDYLVGGRFRDLGAGDPAMRTEQWTPSQWTYAGGVFRAQKPLDDEQGTGMLDSDRALDQLLAGERAPGAVPRIGWGRNEFVRSSDASGQPDVTQFDYNINVPLTEGTFLTATLCWDRMVNETDAGHTNDPNDNMSPPTSEHGKVDRGDHYVFYNMTDLNLQILKKNDMGGLTLIAESISTTDNVEHLHIPIAMRGEYTIRVLWNGEENGAAVLFNTPYALAWYAVPTPGTAATFLLGTLLMGARRRA